MSEKRIKPQDDPDQFNFLNFDEAVARLEQITKEGDYFSTDIMLADKGSNGASQEKQIKYKVDPKKAVTELNKLIEKNGGDTGFALHALMVKDY